MHKIDEDCENGQACPQIYNIKELAERIERIDKFINIAIPSVRYVNAEIKRNERRSDMYRVITQSVAGSVVVIILTTLGAWLFRKLNLDFWAAP